MKERSGTKVVDCSILHRSSRATGEHEADMLDVAARFAYTRADV